MLSSTYVWRYTRTYIKLSTVSQHREQTFSCLLFTVHFSACSPLLHSVVMFVKSSSNNLYTSIRVKVLYLRKRQRSMLWLRGKVVQFTKPKYPFTCTRHQHCLSVFWLFFVNTAPPQIQYVKSCTWKLCLANLSSPSVFTSSFLGATVIAAITKSPDSHTQKYVNAAHSRGNSRDLPLP